MYYTGSFLALGYTTDNLKVVGRAYIGMILLHLADPTFITMCVMSKFYIYKTLGLNQLIRWARKHRGFGK